MLNRDSDLDNGIIAHEYCHGLSNRLTGGPSTTSCLNGNQRASEGWSDICTLFFSPDEADTAISPHGVGTYVTFEPSDGGGIRPSPYTTENVSFIGRLSDGAWRSLWNVQFVGGDPEDFPVRQTVIPIRARFAVPTAVAVDEAAEVPEQIVLYPNFPNPFNPTTSIRYALPQATEVRLAVYDVLGRQVAVLAEGMKPPGEHRVEVDAGRWASGLYFYTIEAAGQKQTQHMMLIK